MAAPNVSAPALEVIPKVFTVAVPPLSLVMFLTMVRVGFGTTVSTSWAELFDKSGSVTPEGTVIVAEFVTVVCANTLEANKPKRIAAIVRRKRL